MSDPIRGIIRGYMFQETRTDLLFLLRLVASHQVTPYIAMDIIEQYVIAGRDLPDYLPELEIDRENIGEN